MFRYLEKIQIKLRICPDCMSDNVKTEHVLTELPIKEDWQKVHYYKPLIKCQDCGVTSDAVEGKMATHDAACLAMGLLPPKEIKRIRNELGFTNAVEFARFLGVGDSTVKRWEARITFPDKNQIKLINIAVCVGKDAFKAFSSFERLFAVSNIQHIASEDNVVELDQIRMRRKEAFSASQGSATDEELDARAQRAADFNRRMIGR